MLLRALRAMTSNIVCLDSVRVDSVQVLRGRTTSAVAFGQITDALAIATARAAAAACLLGATATAASAQSMVLPGKFDVSASGAATYSIPIEVPPGTAGVVPSLSINYNSQAGADGLLGVGWSLGGLSSIGRCPQTLAQDGAASGVNDSASDRFCVDSQRGRRLVAINGGSYGADGTEYRTEVESFSRIISHGTAGTGPAWFEVHTKSGQILQFGNTPDSQILAQGASTVRTWALNRVSDTAGNYFKVTYTNDASAGQAYPTRIDYTANDAAGLAPYNSVQFTYGTRSDVVRLYQASAWSQISVLLTHVTTYAGAAVAADYSLSYLPSPSIGRSRLQSVVRCGGDGACVPATTIAWTNGTSTFTSPASWVTQGGTFAAGEAQYADINGDGLSDLIYQGVDNRFWLSLSTASGFTSPAMVLDLGGSFQAGQVQYADVNGDGRADLIYQGTDASGNQVFYVALSTGSGFAPPAIWMGQGGGFVAGKAQYADVNGDGRADLIYQGTDATGLQAFYVSLSTGSGFTSPAIWVTQGGTFTAGMAQYADVNGDGLADLIYQGTDTSGNQAFYVSLSTGSGFTAPAIWATMGGTFVAGKAQYADVNGDGLADLIYQGTDTSGNQAFYVCLSTGTGFAAPVIWSTMGGTFVAGKAHYADVNGDGMADFIYQGTDTSGNQAFYVSLSTGSNLTAPSIWVTQGGTYVFGKAQYADVNGDGMADLIYEGTDASGNLAFWVSTAAGTRADLVASVTNGIGATASVTYLPLTNPSVYLKDATAAYPLMDFQGPLYVTSRVDASNGIGGSYSLAYAYAGAELDHSGRGLLGFRQRTVTDLQTGIVQTTNYRQDFPFIGLIASATKALSGQVLNVTVNSYQFVNAGGTASVSTPSMTAAPYVVSLLQSSVSSYDLDGSAMPELKTTYQYDAFGNATQVVASTSDGFVKTTTNTYTNDTTNWLLGRLTAASVTSQIPAQGSVPPAASTADLTISKTHSGNLTQGQTGATYTITVSNVGAWQTVGAVTVTDGLPSSLAASSMSGEGWSCNVGTLTCTRSDPLAAGASYQPVTLVVNVAANAPASVTNVATVSGGGETNTANDTASDPTTISPPVSVTISASSNNLNLWNYLTTNGYATAGQPGGWIVTVASGVVIGSASTSEYALDTGLFPAGSALTIVNNGTIVGAGGNGGAGGVVGPVGCTSSVPGAGGSGGGALHAQLPMTVVNNGQIWGGGGVAAAAHRSPAASLRPARPTS